MAFEFNPHRHPGLVPGSTGRPGGGAGGAWASRLRHGGPRNRSGVTKKKGFTRRREDAKKIGSRRGAEGAEVRRAECLRRQIRHPGLVPGSTGRLGGGQEVACFSVAARWAPEQVRGDEEEGVHAKTRRREEDWFARRRGGRGERVQGYCWRAWISDSTSIASGVTR